MVMFLDQITPELVREYSSSLFVFGDNLVGKGYKGQAIIRDEENSFGIPTKIIPSMHSKAFFSDRDIEIAIVKDKIKTLRFLIKNGAGVVFPTKPPGSGLAKLEEKSPKAYKLITDLYDELKEKRV